MIRFAFLLLACLSLLASPVAAAGAEKTPSRTASKKAPAKTAAPEKPKAQKLGSFGAWTSYLIYEGKNPVCYMSLTARPPGAKSTARPPVTLMVTHRPAESSSDVVSYAAGFKYKPGSDVTLQIGGKSFSLFTQDTTAWARDALTDRAIVAAMREASSMTVSGFSATGKPFGDTIALKGAAEAHVAASKACGLKVEEPPKPAVKKETKKTTKAATPAKKQTKTKTSKQPTNEKPKR